MERTSINHNESSKIMYVVVGSIWNWALSNCITTCSAKGTSESLMHHSQNEVGGDITAAQAEGTSLCSWLVHVASPACEGHLPGATY